MIPIAMLLGELRFPVSYPISQLYSPISRCGKQMDVIWHDDILTYKPCVGICPNRI